MFKNYNVNDMNKLSYTLRSRNTGEIDVFHKQESRHVYVPYYKCGVTFQCDSSLVYGCSTKKFVVDTTLDGSDGSYALRSRPDSTEEAFEIKRKALEII